MLLGTGRERGPGAPSLRQVLRTIERHLDDYLTDAQRIA
jgi:hypothetical protein